MKYVPKSLSRSATRAMLKLNAKSPTLLVVGGVVGFGVTAVMAAQATRKIDPILEKHVLQRDDVRAFLDVRGGSYEAKKELLKVYSGTTLSLAKIYAPTIVVGSLSAAAVLSGHNILKGRHVATMAAYSGLAEEFRSYRERVSESLGAKEEQELYDGGQHAWADDPVHPGESKRVALHDPTVQNYLRPWFDETNINFTRDPNTNYLFLKGAQTYMNYRLQARGHVFLNEVLDHLGLPRCSEGAVAGWLWRPEDENRDNYIDFGFLASADPHTVAFRNQAENTVRLNFNIDGVIWSEI